MRKLLLLFSIVLLLSPARAQWPAGYYDSAAGLSGEALRIALHDIISNGFTSVSYSNLFDYVYAQTDVKPNGKLWDTYSDVPGGTPPYEFTLVSDQCGTYSSEGDCYNREHTVPASWFNDASPMYSDVFMVLPTDGYVNNKRSNYPYGEVGSVSWTSQNGSKLGSCNYSGYTGTVFEPVDSFKGDFARIYFYMAVRYKDEISSWSGASFSGSDLSSWTESMMLEWHALDPVSTKEKERNNSVYNIQHNRNPFVDHPEWVYAIWGATAGDQEAAISPGLRIFPQPASDYLQYEFDPGFVLKEVQVYSLQGVLVEIICGENYINLQNLQSGLYSLRFIFDKAVENKIITVQH